MLDGGYPEERAVLLTSTPGTGKSTLAMQFLQEGLQNGESWLFISTEQTVDELRTRSHHSNSILSTNNSR
ncbi:circadian oscillation regulator KaiC-like protein [halophilic archaeon DL31]|jgi:circadian clock protein KaiC|nr:circadian oscillation regulator KaiC-like protein [halophilic archaeon DL31]